MGEIHKQNRVFSCDWDNENCGAVFSAPGTLRRHILTHTDQQFSRLCKDIGTEGLQLVGAQPINIGSCQLCQMLFVLESNLKLHCEYYRKKYTNTKTNQVQNNSESTKMPSPNI